MNRVLWSTMCKTVVRTHVCVHISCAVFDLQQIFGADHIRISLRSLATEN